MTRGWEVEYENGHVIQEEQMEWKDLPNKKDIVRVTLRWDGRRWDIKNKEAYFQRKRASMVPGVAESFRIEARMIGYYEGNKKVMYEVNEFTGEMKLKVIEG